MKIKTAEQNWEFNTKKKIPSGKAIGYKDGNAENTMFNNLILVDAKTKKTPKKEETKPLKEEIPAEEPKKKAKV